MDSRSPASISLHLTQLNQDFLGVQTYNASIQQTGISISKSAWSIEQDPVLISSN